MTTAWLRPDRAHSRRRTVGWERFACTCTNLQETRTPGQSSGRRKREILAACGWGPANGWRVVHELFILDVLSASERLDVVRARPIGAPGLIAAAALLGV